MSSGVEQLSSNDELLKKIEKFCDLSEEQLWFASLFLSEKKKEAIKQWLMRYFLGEDQILSPMLKKKLPENTQKYIESQRSELLKDPKYIAFVTQNRAKILAEECWHNRQDEWVTWQQPWSSSDCGKTTPSQEIDPWISWGTPWTSESWAVENQDSFENELISPERVREVCDYISWKGKYYSNSKKQYVSWWVGKYKWLCTTWTYAILALLLSKEPVNQDARQHYFDAHGMERNTNHIFFDGNDEKLRKMHCYPYIKYNPKLETSWVDPTDPSASGYVPKIWDVAVRDPFPLNPKHPEKKTQHMAIYTEVRINGKIERRWVSDTIQPRMSCYNATPDRERYPTEPNVSIYRLWSC